MTPVAYSLALLDLTLLDSAGGEFITNDRGLAMRDPDLCPGQGHAWESSPPSETTSPVAPNACIKLTPVTRGSQFSRRPPTKSSR